MPQTHRFRHQAYRSDRPTSPYQLLQPECPADPTSAEFHQRIEATGDALAQANVVAVYCVHGTFAGTDALGLLTELSRFAPSLASTLRRLGKRAVDWCAGETGNYTTEFTATMEAGLSRGAGRQIPVRRFLWSSQNNHIGRAEGAVLLLDELANLAGRRLAGGRSDRQSVSRMNAESEMPPRVVLWGHSHAGNLFALLTNLLAADAGERQLFFDASGCFYRRWWNKRVDMRVWPRVEELLRETEHPLRRLALDVVTFGTPIRYDWNADGYANLLHFVNHRPPDNRPPYLAAYPLELLRMFHASDGDYVNQIGIAGSNIIPNPLAVRTLVTDWRLDKLLERNLLQESLLKRISHGTRVPDAGTTLLVDYPDPETALHRHLMGHAVYTRQRWLPFHLEQMAAHFYGSNGCSVVAT